MKLNNLVEVYLNNNDKQGNNIYYRLLKVKKY